MSLTTSQIISVDELRAAVSRMPKTIPPWMGDEGARYQLTVSPGMVRVARRDPQAAERAFDKRFGERAREVRAMLEDETNQTFVANGYPEGVANLKGIHPGMTGEKRGSIRGFSRQSRARMVRTLCELDYSPLFEGGSKPGMLTLTVPGEWEKLFPTVKQYKAAINRFRVAYRYSWGREIVGVWKNEYQRRGAPHLHLMMVIPKGRAKGTGEDFRTWAAREWARACRTLEKLCKCDLEVITEHPRECEYSKHVAAGIRVDFDEAGNWSDAKRIAIYYAKHGLFGAKEYQNQPPELWVEAGAVGRFWGYWGLRKGGVTIEVDMRRVVKDPDPSAEIQKTIEKCLAAGIQVTPALTEHVSNRDYRQIVGVVALARNHDRRRVNCNPGAHRIAVASEDRAVGDSGVSETNLLCCSQRCDIATPAFPVKPFELAPLEDGSITARVASDINPIPR